MAIDLQATNGTASSTHERYYTAPDHSTWDIPADTDFTLYGVVYVQDNTATKYWFSNGAYKAANSVNMIVYNTGGSFGFAATYGTVEVNWGLGNLTGLDRYYVHYMAGRSGLLYCGACEMGGAISNQTVTGASIAGVGISPTGLLNIGRRQDGNLGRYFRGRIDRFGLNVGYGASHTEMEAIAAGTLPSASALGSNGTLVERANFTSATPATITGLEASQVFTKQGTGYGANETSPFGGGSAVKGISIPLYDGATSLTSLSNIQVLAFDNDEPGDASTVINLGKTNTTNGSGNLIVATPTSTRSIGQDVFAVAYQLDGTDHRDSRQHMTKTPLVDIS